ncbi:MAG: zinc ribbon domain-containing protein [Acidobacteria bacterium]|nr:zinc ribbon domain-containing protein [Acidobacteriota bacterium]
MPLYEYKCQSCGTVFEKMQKFSDAELTVHEDCGGALERLISAPGLHFKGSGWYITDYARSGGSKPPAPASSGESKSDTKADTTTATKSETKTESKTTKTESK